MNKFFRSYTHVKQIIRSKVYESRHYDYDDEFRYIDIDGIETDRNYRVLAIVEVKTGDEKLSDSQEKFLIHLADNEFKHPIPLFIVRIKPDFSKVSARPWNEAAYPYGGADNEGEWLRILYKLRNKEPNEELISDVESSRKEFIKWYNTKRLSEAEKIVHDSKNSTTKATPLE